MTGWQGLGQSGPGPRRPGDDGSLALPTANPRCDTGRALLFSGLHFPVCGMKVSSLNSDVRILWCSRVWEIPEGCGNSQADLVSDSLSTCL